MNYERDMKIDETSLDVEWLEQANLALRYGKHWAVCNKRVLELDERIKVIRAELVAEANSDPERCCNKEKPNAADIEAYYRNHRRHKRAKEEWVQAQFELDIATVAKNEISFTRKAALEQLVALFLGNYFAGPKVPRNLTEQREVFQKKINAKIASSLKRRT
jgi:hypothetical protein